jgi:hypothetical protein
VNRVKRLLDRARKLRAARTGDLAAAAAEAAELEQYNAAVDAVWDLPGMDDAARQLVVEYCRSLLRYLPVPRMPAALAVFLRAVPADLRRVAVGALHWETSPHNGNCRGNWAGAWVSNLASLEARIPPGVADGAVRGVIRVFDYRFGEPGYETVSTVVVCPGCGFRWPRKHIPPERETWILGQRECVPPPEWFESCPACGGSEYLTFVEKTADCAWKAVAERELAEALQIRGR